MSEFLKENNFQSITLADGQQMMVGKCNSFKKLYDYAHQNNKRLTVVKCENDTWTDMAVIPTSELELENILYNSGAFSHLRVISFDNQFDKFYDDAIRFKSANGIEPSELLAMQKEHDATLELFKSNKVGYNKDMALVVNKETYSIHGIFPECASYIEFSGITLAIAIADPLPITERTLARLEADDIMPCVAGRMPEDFIQYKDKLSNKVNKKLKVYDDEYHNEDFMGPFTIFDYDGYEMGFAYRKFIKGEWYWVDGEHSNVSVPSTRNVEKDKSKDNNDAAFVAWRLNLINAYTDNYGSLLSMNLE